MPTSPIWVTTQIGEAESPSQAMSIITDSIFASDTGEFGSEYTVTINGIKITVNAEIAS